MEKDKENTGKQMYRTSDSGSRSTRRHTIVSWYGSIIRHNLHGSVWENAFIFLRKGSARMDEMTKKSKYLHIPGALPWSRRNILPKGISAESEPCKRISALGRLLHRDKRELTAMPRLNQEEMFKWENWEMYPHWDQFEEFAAAELV